MKNIKSRLSGELLLKDEEYFSLGRQILYEDNHLLIINKLASQIVQGDKSGDTPLSELFKAFIKKRDQKPGQVYLGLVHRLDRPVSGALILAKTDKALSRMNQLLREREFQKTYWAITRNKPPQIQDYLTNWLKKNEKLNKSFVVSQTEKEALKAELEYRLLFSSDAYHLLEVKLHTGRHHQIRVQLSSINCPIKGDLKYGDKRSQADGSICLHARSVEFIHPVKKEVLRIMAPVPADDTLWGFFEGAASSCIS